jgi:hypothetical protein
VTPLTKQNQINDMFVYCSYRTHGVHYIDEVAGVCHLLDSPSPFTCAVRAVVVPIQALRGTSR